MDHIRDASGVSLKRLYRLFPAKEDLVEEVLRRREAAFLRSLRDAAARRGTPRSGARGLRRAARLVRRARIPRLPVPEHVRRDERDVAGLAGVARHQKQGFARHLDELVGALDGPPALTGQLLVLANGAMATSAVLGTPEPALHAKSAAAALLDAAGL